MKQRSKATFLLKMALCVTLALSTFGAVLGFVGRNKVVAQAETVDVSESLDVTDATPSWTHGSDEVVFIIRVTPHSSVAGNWNSSSHTSLKSANGNLDILQYICINGEDARTASTNNQNSVTNHKGESGWLANGGKYAPVYVEVVADQGVVVRIDTDYSTTNFEFTVKSGFALLNSEGNTSAVTEDVKFKYDGSTLTKVVASSGGVVEYQDLLGVENRDWGAHAGEYYFGGVTLDPLGYFNTADSVCGAWYVGNDNIIAANNGVDIMEYIYVNGQSARALITANASGDRLGNSCGCWLSNPAACPVYVETTNGSGILIKILKDFVGETYTLTFKAGFELTRNDGARIHVSKDINYSCEGNKATRLTTNTVTFNDENGNLIDTKFVPNGYAVGTLPAIPEKDGCVGVWAGITEDTIVNSDLTVNLAYAIEYKDLLGIENRSWGAHEGEYYFGGVTLDPLGYFNTADSVCGAWYVGNNNIIAANNGVDIMEYIYVNGQSARALITANASGDRLGNSCSCWLSNPAACPVYVETTNGSGILIKILKDFVGETYTITFKAGFMLTRNDGQIIYLSEDVDYNCVGNACTRVQKCTVTFKGVEDRTVVSGQPIGELPAVPAKAGYTEGAWAINGQFITADTVVDGNVTAVAVYSKDITETIGLGDWGSPETESDIRYLFIQNSGSDIASAFSNPYWNDHEDNKNINFGVDIMSYILIDGVSARELSNKNATDKTYKAASTFPLNVGGCYAPVCIETAAKNIRFKVMLEFKTSFDVTFKAGFSLLTADGIRLYVSEDVTYHVGETIGDIQKVVEAEGPIAMDDKISIGTWNEAETGITWMHVAFNGFSVAGADWHIADGKIDNNNGVDPLEYVIINGETARSHYVANNSSLTAMTATGWVEAFVVKVSKDYLDLGEFTFQLLAGFTFVGTDDKVYVLENDTAIYGWDNGNFGVVAEHMSPAPEEVDVTETIKIEFSKKGTDESQFKINITPSSELTSNGWWNIYGDRLTAANNGVDIMDYIYVNGQSIRDLSDDNRANNTYPLGNGTGWFTNSDQCRPVFVETNGDGIWVRVLHSFSTTEFTVTLKAGLKVLNSNGAISVISEDVSFYCSGVTGKVTKIEEYTLSFEGLDENISVVYGQPIGELPAAPHREGYVGVWTIDGVEITAETIYTFEESKTAAALYKVDVADTIKIEFSLSGTNESQFKIFITPSSALTSNGWWNIYGDRLTAANNGVDIMEYIYVNDQNIRDLSDNNRTNNTYPLGNGTGWFTNSNQCRPVFVETNGNGIWVRVLHSFSGEEFVVTLKAGFEILNSDGTVSVISKDVSFFCSGATGAVTQMKEYTLSFEGLDETITVIGGQTIGTLPNVPVVGDGEGYWTIDGVRIAEDTVYTYGENKTAVAAYDIDITKTFDLEDRTSWGAHAGEYYFGVLDNREGNATVNGESTTYYLNTSAAINDCWYVGKESIITANGGVDIMQYILINGVSARELITANANGDRHGNDCNCWLSNPAAYPVYVETHASAGLMIKVATAHVGDYFEITFKAGFSVINAAESRVYLSEDITYKYIVSSGSAALSKGEITDEDLDQLNGQEIELIVNGESYFVKKTVRLTLPKLESVVNENGLSKVFLGWTADINNVSSANLYPAGYKFTPSEATSLHAVWIGFEMEEGAAIRLASDYGIRFTVFVDVEGYTSGVSKGLITEVGTILCPTSYLLDGRELTHSTLPSGYFTSSAADVAKMIEKDGAYKYATAFVGLEEKDFSREYSARGYIKVQFATGEGYVYTDYSAENNARSMYQVAEKAYNDTEVDYTQNQTILTILNSVLDLTWTEDYEIVVNDNAIGNCEVTDVTLDGYTFTIMYTGNASSVVINGERLAVGNNVNVAIGDLLYNFSDLVFVDGGVQFNVGAATNTYNKHSSEALYFASSDADLDFFLNDFFKRHTGTIENGERLSVNSAIAGVNAEEFFNQEWVSMSYYWYNASEGFTDERGYNEDRIAGLNARLANVPVDDYGYVWSSNDRVRDPYSEVATGEQKMGWPFPNNDTVSTSHWEFNGKDNGSWTSNIGASVKGGLYQANVTNQSSNVTFTSNSFASYSSKRIYTKYAPLLEFEVRIADVTNVDDIVVWYTTSSSTSFSNDKKVSVKGNAFLSYDLGSATGAYEHILYLPMYAQTAWGESTSVYVKQLKIEIVLKSGTTLSGNVALNYVRPTLDTRMSNNNSIYISSLRTAYDYTGDVDLLVANITKARKAYNFLMQMYDESRGLKKESYLVGHGGAKGDLNWLGKATADSIANSISQGYWDIMYMPEYDFQSNVYFQKALVDMAYLEEALTAAGKSVTMSLANVKTATRGGGYSTCEYTEFGMSATEIKNYASANLTAIQANLADGGFWNPTTGRFAAGYDVEGTLYDYGYVAWNLEAIYYGVATDGQASSIMNWLSTEEDLYKYVFAPLSITETGDSNALNGEYEAKGDRWVNCQFGGAILYTSFYDIVARIEVNGADDAFDRLQAMQAWYKEVYDYYVANGTDPYDFYRYYYDNKGIQMQGLGTAGAVGIDREFLESVLPIASVAYGFFGIDAVDSKTLEVAPELPAELTMWSMENLAFNFVKYDLTIYANAVQLSNVRGDVTGLTLNVVLDYVDGQKVFVNGVETTNYTVENGKVIVTVAFGATVVEVR